jgi:serine-type D-Ala-D-Ala carboxypeptidase (penicillin-binding protein 5/6)
MILIARAALLATFLLATITVTVVAAETKKPASKSTNSKSAKAAPLAPGELPVKARGAIALNGKTGEVLYERNADVVEYPASSTKILTALLIIEAGNLDKIVTVEEADTKVEPTALFIKAGEQYPRKHLLYALMMKSANDAAMALARDNAGSIEAFAEKMNNRAKDLGAIASHFMNPHGLHHPHHFVTARDLSKIALTAMKIPLFREIVSTQEAWLVKGDEWQRIRNTNRLLGKMPGCIGCKTGFTRPAQQVLVSAACRQDHEVLAVVLHTDKPGIWDDSRLMLVFGLAKLGVAPAAGDPALPPLALAPPTLPADPADPAKSQAPEAPAGGQ